MSERGTRQAWSRRVAPLVVGVVGSAAGVAMVVEAETARDGVVADTSACVRAVVSLGFGSVFEFRTDRRSGCLSGLAAPSPGR